MNVLTVSEEALALFALEDRYEFWYRSYIDSQCSVSMPEPHPRNQVLIEEAKAKQDKEVTDVTRVMPRRQRRRSSTNRSNSVTDDGVSDDVETSTVVTDDVEQVTVESLKLPSTYGGTPTFTSGRPQAWPVVAVMRYNYWCKFVSNFRDDDMKVKALQAAVDLHKTDEDYLGLSERKRKGKRSLLEMNAQSEDEARGRVGGIFDGTKIGNADLSIVGTVYSKYNAKYVERGTGSDEEN